MQHFANYLLPCAGLAILCGAALPPARAQGVPAHIRILVSAGDATPVNAGQRLLQDPSVTVEDDDHRPVAGAVVVFVLPVSGSTGEFPNGSKNLTVVTDANGVATARGIRVNDVPGKLQIYVTASYRGLRARALIDEFIAAAPGAKNRTREVQVSRSGGKWKWVMLGVAVAGGAGAGLYFGRHTTTPSPTSISAGTVVFGSPR